MFNNEIPVKKKKKNSLVITHDPAKKNYQSDNHDKQMMPK